MIRIPKELQGYVEFVENDVIAKDNIPDELKAEFKRFKKRYKELHKKNTLTDY